MSIESSKPILLTLHLEVTDSWAAMLTIPATSQYKTHHYFPGLETNYFFHSSVAVNKVKHIRMVFKNYLYTYK